MFKRKFPFITVLALAVLFIPASALPQGESGIPQRMSVYSLKFSGIPFLEKGSLSDLLVSKPRAWWRFWQKRPVITAIDLDQDLLRIRQYFRKKGYYGVSARYTLESVQCPMTTGKDGEEKPCLISVKFFINLGKRARVRAISWDIVNQPPANVSGRINTGSRISIDYLEKLITITVGKPFSDEKLQESKRIIAKALGNLGYPKATVKAKAKIDLNTASATVKFSIDPGPECRFGEIRIQGNNGFIDTEVLARAIPIKTGAPFRADRLDEARANLYALKVFSTALVEPGEIREKENMVPVVVKIEPGKQHSVELGAGYGTEDRLRLRLGWRYRNLTGHADRLSLSARGSSLSKNLTAHYTCPYFIDAKNTLSITVQASLETETFYDLDATRAGLLFSRNLTKSLLLSGEYRFSANKLKNVSTAIETESADTENQDGNGHDKISALVFRIEKDKRNDPINPTSGYVASFSVESAYKEFGSDIEYISPRAEIKGYHPLFWGVRLAARINYQWIRGYGGTEGLPAYLMLYSGGSKSVRGYAYQRLGAYDNSGRLISVSGKSLFNGNIELRFPVYGSFEGAFFFDTGGLYKGALEFSSKKLKYTCGAGLRIYTAVGPIQFDIGYKLNPPKGSLVSGEAADTGKWRVHLNLGYPF